MNGCSGKQAAPMKHIKRALNAGFQNENWPLHRGAKILERVKGIEPSYSAWKSANFRNFFQEPFRHFAAFCAIEVTTEFLFVGMAATT
jgi:hypothetical protein